MPTFPLYCPTTYVEHSFTTDRHHSKASHYAVFPNNRITDQRTPAAWLEPIADAYESAHEAIRYSALIAQSTKSSANPLRQGSLLSGQQCCTGGSTLPVASCSNLWACLAAHAARPDAHGISSRKDKILAVFMIGLAVFASFVAIYSDAYAIFKKNASPSRE
ncbi:hypothetical protein PHJA_000871300 [Phtheirospermum japonicum]|uniref:Uncharacterized protein n=1 Tax=Phtheirospermum japonicum TaxID=374723 RepID=A0A830BK93_9LAMI|nr:hypothetical protein PHJA_000871300 [Phtheirospermum japonicum]